MRDIAAVLASSQSSQQPDTAAVVLLRRRANRHGEGRYLPKIQPRSACSQTGRQKRELVGGGGRGYGDCGRWGLREEGVGKEVKKMKGRWG